MQGPDALPLAAWGNFYVIIGSSSAALTGLMFVVISLVSQRQARQAAEVGLAAFATPTIVHFCAAFLVSAIASAPWRSASSASFLTGVVGILGVAYVLIVTWRARRQTSYKPVLEDWLWHTFFPLGAYATFVAAATVPPRNLTAALFATGAATISLLFIGVHNAWDAVIYNAIARARLEEPEATTRADTTKEDGA
jgi:F0F1-type ATP synthase assembly protein I